MVKKKEADMTLVVDKMGVVIEFTTPMLGTVPKNPEVYKEYIATKAPKEVNTSDEVATVPVMTNEEMEGIEAKGWTGFHVLDGELFVYDYMVSNLATCMG